MNIALVWPKSTFLIDPMYYPPLGLWYIHSMLTSKGHSVVFFDLDEDSPDYQSFDQVWISGTTPQWPFMKEVIKDIPASVKVVVGGPHATLHSDKMAPWADLAVVGEISLDDIDNIIHAEGVLSIKNRPSLLDAQPPYRGDAHRYNATLKGVPCTSAMTSIGCPYKCAFCNTNALYGRLVRYFPLVTVRNDLENIIRHGFGAVQFYDDILPIQVERTEKIADMLSYHRLIWRCFFRSDLGVKAGYDFLLYLRRRGLEEVLVGVESASNAVKKRIHKGTVVEQDTIFREWCWDLGITYKASFILGLPGETLETMSETRKWILENRPDKVDINVLIPMPGTPIWDSPEDYGCQWTVHNIDENFFKGRYGEVNSLVRTDALSPEQISDYRLRLQHELLNAGISY